MPQKFCVFQYRVTGIKLPFLAFITSVTSTISLDLTWPECWCLIIREVFQAHPSPPPTPHGWRLRCKGVGRVHSFCRVCEWGPAFPPGSLQCLLSRCQGLWPVFVWCRSLPVSSFFFHVSVYLQFIPHSFLRTPGFEFSAQFKEGSGMISPWIISAETQFVLIRSYSKVPAGRIGKCVWDGHRSTCHSYQKYIIHFEYWVSYSQEYDTTVKMWLPGTLSEYSMVLPSKYFSSLNHYVGESL